MKKANIISITNLSDLDVVLWPRNRDFAKRFAIYVRANSFIISDFHSYNQWIDLDLFYFRFQGKRKRIKVDDCLNHEIDLWYEYCEK